ncbi:hypothetical protein KJ866_02910 [Patescibacteria group bacterium]|nr:hypothetical protein [Patescibacteria group bacterium]MBU2220157.1 hypothetical protein [Patescibacteria group bacterium]MBU2265117.1 hypothetical protein [Patescibacteria group bacterium]
MFKKKPKSKKEDDFFFDDCPICRAMKAAEKEGRNLNEAELKEAFGRAKNKDAMVGGEWFEEK